MAFLDNSDANNIPVNVDTRQAEEKLRNLQDQFLELKKLFASITVGINTPSGSGGTSLQNSITTGVSRTLGQTLNKSVGSLATTLPSILNGALRGFARNGLSGGIFGGLSSLLKGGALSGLTGLAGLPFGALGTALSGVLGNLFGSKSRAAREAQQQQEQLEKTRELMQRILSKIDTNDLNSLQRALNQVQQFTSGGGAAFQEKRSTASQLKQAIKERQQVITEAIRNFAQQNAALSAELQKFSDTPLENLDIDRNNSLNDLTIERDKALADYKDSLEAQRAIEQNFELKRQALLTQASIDIIDLIVDEQNKIRSLQAQTAVNTAKTSGNAIQVINAELQARLVAIDNDVAAFKGAEEEKTAFLKEKASERTLAIQNANQDISDLLQDGLAILNEGLVVGQSKEASQKDRLNQLFGALNPLGLIQSDGQLLQSNVSLGSGAIQMTFEGVQDAQALIAQLSDPIIQNKLIAALNNAISRT